MSKELHQKRMNNVVQYIEKHIDEALNISTLSSLSCYSEFHFHRLFRSYIGESVYGYRKRLLLERAVKQLLYSQESITEIAFNAGYENQTSFNKAFKHQYSYTPSQVRKQKVSIRQQPLKLDDNRQIKMKVTITDIEDIHVICARETGSYDIAAPKAWQRIMKFGYSNRLMNKDVRSIGITHDDPKVTAANQIRYDACLDLETPPTIKLAPQDNLSEHTIVGGKYAVFMHMGEYQYLANTYADIFNEWLPSSRFELRDEHPCFEVYLNRDPRKTKPENLKTEIYVPLT